jgi:hypothetical protein
VSVCVSVYVCERVCVSEYVVADLAVDNECERVGE